MLEDGEDLLFFRDPEKASQFIEAWSVPDQGSLAFGLDGSQFLITRLVDPAGGRLRGLQVIIAPVSPDDLHDETLEAVLARHLVDDPTASTCPLAGLLELAIHRYGWAA